MTRSHVRTSDEPKMASIAGSGTPRLGATATAVDEVSEAGGEPAWMTELRRAALDGFDAASFAQWCAVHAPELDDDRTGAQRVVPGGRAFDGSIDAQGVVFCDLAIALREHPDPIRRSFGTVVPFDDGLTALNSALWTAGTFIMVPPGVEVDLAAPTDPRAVHRFERTLLIAGEGSTVRYLGGCAAPAYRADPLHSVVVEVVVGAGASVTCTTIQNWASHAVSVVAQRARVEDGGHMTWIDGDLGSRRTDKTTAIDLVGRDASGHVLEVASAGDGQHLEVATEFVHSAPNTTSDLVSKAIGRGGGAVRLPWSVNVADGVVGATSSIGSDALIVDGEPSLSVESRTDSSVEEAVSRRETVARVSDEQRFYLRTRGLSAEQAEAFVVNGFVEPVTRHLPIEYALEWSRLVEMQFEGSVG